MSTKFNFSEIDKRVGRSHIVISTLIGAGLTLISISLGFYTTLDRAFFPWEGKNYAFFATYIIYLVSGSIVFIWGLTLANRLFGRTRTPNIYSLASKPANGPFFVIFVEGLDSKNNNASTDTSPAEQAFADFVNRLNAEDVPVRLARIITKDGMKDYAFRKDQKEEST
ncbi:MAG: hypothetical protein DA330_01135 [Nitrososphaera sp.]|nr:hypothetical protein [Nitrososphaera sp.]